MEELLDLILYENENTRLDFKRDEYKKEDYSSFLKDVISMANAFSTQDRFIIIGLKPKSVEDRGIKGIDGELTDAATFQQLVHENIEPELSLEYFPFTIEKTKIGIIKISNCNNPPYLMKKDYGYNTPQN
jgi:predicted HTH transcriptional regulator